MATLLHRLGRTAFRRRRLVALLWAVVLVAVGVGAAKAPAAGDSGTAFMPGIEAQKAFDLIGQRFPGADADGATACGIPVLVRTAPRGPALTPQQSQIARLAATGLTNKQIGQRLLLSPRTVSTHLHQLFPKLGVTSRAALRDALEQLEQLDQPEGR
ncbi:helix-turn-helix transcriptional regulator [Streptomyces sp. NBC_00448]|uniref:helix-turn-helix transcriptional regulator n=1 Tax=Streptomyces sp. NBC_00448 TaxID=2903652 RepID=UPI002E20C793